MNTPQHTPTPWEAYHDIQYGWMLRDRDGKDIQFNESNARFMVKAVNSYDRLVEAFRELANIATHPQAKKEDIRRIAREKYSILADIEG